MPRVLAVPILLLLLLAGPLRPAAASAAPHAQSAPAAEILRLVNQVRAEHGLPPYTYNGTLAVAAARHANWMAANMVFSSHTGEAGTSPQDRANQAGYNGFVAENIVGGTGMNPQQGLIWWRNSPLHYRMMVSTRYTEAGVAYASNGSENMYVLLMGRPSNEPITGPADAQPDPLFITPIQLAQPREDGSIVHVVQEGQALWQIAAHYEANLSDLLLFNGLGEEDFLQPGDEVIIRLADDATPPPTPTPPLTHTVREGDNAWIIAVRYGVDLQTIFYLNGFGEERVLQPGEEVKVRLAPGEPPPPTPTPKMAHKVREGETLWTVAALNGLTVEELLAFNGLTENAMIYPGDMLYIRATFTPTPEATETPAATAAPAPTGEPAREVAILPTARPSATPRPATTGVPLSSLAAEATLPEQGGPSLLTGTLLFAVALVAVAALLVWRGRS